MGVRSGFQTCKTTRASAVVSSPSCAFKPFHEFALVIQDDVNLQFASGTAVPNLVIDDDAGEQRPEGGQLPRRAALVPRRLGAGDAAHRQACFRTRQFPQFDQILHNSWVGGPTPRRRSSRPRPARTCASAWSIRPATPRRTSSSSTATPGWSGRTSPDSTQIGSNPTSEWFGTRGGVGPSDHFDALIPDGAGGKFKITGDYLWRDYSGPRLDAGIWGLLRIIP